MDTAAATTTATTSAGALEQHQEKLLLLATLNLNVKPPYWQVKNVWWQLIGCNLTFALLSLVASS